MNDYYEILEVSREANPDEVKRSYKRLALRYHPDRNPGDAAAEARFKAVCVAYDTLSDPSRRRHYDRFGAAAAASVGANGQTPDLNTVGEIFQEFFEDMFSRRAKRRRSGRDIEMDIELTFEEAVLGCKKTVTVQRRNLDGQPGPRVELAASIPAGVDDGAMRTVKGQGQPGEKGPGDLHLRIRVARHPILSREGNDIHVTVPVNYPQAVLGAQLEIPTVEGPVKMKLPAGTPSGKVLRLKGKGVPRVGGRGRGDQLVQIVVEVPTQVSQKQRALLRQLAAELDDNNANVRQ